MANAPAAMTLTGGKEKLLGTNPFAIGIPSEDKKPIIFDMASSQVSKSKIGSSYLNGNDIPLGWAYDKDGNPTTDPQKAIEGFLEPLGGYKGIGIAMSIDILAGLLSGASYLDKVGKFYDYSKSMKVGHLYIAINPKRIYGEDFYNKVNDYKKKLRSSKTWRNEKIHIPGDSKIEKG